MLRASTHAGRLRCTPRAGPATRARPRREHLACGLHIADVAASGGFADHALTLSVSSGPLTRETDLEVDVE